MLNTPKRLVLLLSGLLLSGNAYAFMAGAFDGLLIAMGVAVGVLAYITAFVIRRYFWVLRRLADFIAASGCMVFVLVWYAERQNLTNFHDLWELILPATIVFLVLTACYWFIPAKRKDPQYSIVQFILLVLITAVTVTACNYGKRELRIRKNAEHRAKYQQQLKESTTQQTENAKEISDRRSDRVSTRIRNLPARPDTPIIMIGPESGKPLQLNGPNTSLENRQPE